MARSTGRRCVSSGRAPERSGGRAGGYWFGRVRRGEAGRFLTLALMPLPGGGRVIFRVSRPELAASKLNRFALVPSCRDFFPRSPPNPSSSRVPRHAMRARWAVSFLPGRAAPAKPRLQALLRDEFADVRIVAAEALAYHGETTDALATLAEIIGGGQPYDVLATLNTLDYAGSLRSRPAPAPRPWGATGN